MKYLIVFFSILSLLLLLRCQLEKIPPVVRTFKMSVKVSESNTTLAGIYQRSKIDSNYYVVMTLPDGVTATVLLDKDGMKVGNVIPYATVKGGIIKAFSDGNDGYFLIGERILNITASPSPVESFFSSIPSSPGTPVYKALTMSPNTPERSNIYDAILTSAGRIMVCGGYYNESTGYDTGIAELETNGTLPSNFPKIMKKYGYFGTGIAEKTDGGFMMTAQCIRTSFPFISCGSRVGRFSNDYTPNLVNWEQLIYLKDWSQNNLSGIEKVGSSLFAIHNSGYIAVIDEEFKVRWEATNTHNVKKIINLADNTLVVLGSKDNIIYLTKRSVDTGEAIWSETYNQPTGTLTAVTVSETLDRGFVIGGNYTKDGKTDIYVIKTDENGKVYE